MHEAAVNYTQEEWEAIIAEAERKLPKTFKTYEAPKPGTVEFAKYIDHTLLKLDATEEQIDQLCKEARQYEFKVGSTMLLQARQLVLELPLSPSI